MRCSGTGWNEGGGPHLFDKLGVTGSSPVPPIEETRWKQRVSSFKLVGCHRVIESGWKENGKVPLPATSYRAEFESGMGLPY